MQEMEEIWARLKAWLKTNAPQILEQLQPGASDEQIRELEEFLDVKLPKDVKASYRICNGQPNSDFKLIDWSELLSLERIKQEYECLKELFDDGDFQDEDGRDYGSDPDPGSGICEVFWWNPKWIPLTADLSGDHYCLDLSPTQEGKMGQIIRFWHDNSERKLIASSLKVWLQRYVDDLESGQFVCSKYNSIVRKNYV